MDEYQFQHEQSQELQKQAVDAVNRTLWLEHWKLSKYSILSTLCFFSGYILLRFFPVRKNNSSGGESGSPTFAEFFQMALVGLGLVVWFLTTLSLSNKVKNLNRVNLPFGISKRIQGIAVCFALAPLLFSGFGTFDQRSMISLILACSIAITLQFIDRRNLKRHLVEWGVLEDPKTVSLFGPAPVSKQLKEAEAVVDHALGAPAKKSAKRKLFVKTKPV
jgi:hypothetical protein